MSNMVFSSQFIEETLNIEFHKNWAEKNLQFLRTPHAFLSSFPRSGNGWIRLVLATTFLELIETDIKKLDICHKNMETGVKYSCLTVNSCDYSIEEIFPDIYHLDIKAHYETMSDSVKRLNIPSKLIKTHHIVDCHSTKTIFLFREPMPCLTSAALYFNRPAITASPYLVDETIEYLAEFYQSMLIHYIDQFQKFPGNILFVNHEKLFKNGTSEVKRILEFLEIDVSLNCLENILIQFPFKSTYEKKIEAHVGAMVKEKMASIHQSEYAEALELANI